MSLEDQSALLLLLLCGPRYLEEEEEEKENKTKLLFQRKVSEVSLLHGFWHLRSRSRRL